MPIPEAIEMYDFIAEMYEDAWCQWYPV
jgi:hypothetical protein